ncbi:MAG: FadR/GntR family transcriptional regulator [Acidobacteriota bacterium]
MEPSATSFSRVSAPENLHDRVTRTLALRVLEAERASRTLVFPNEAELCQQLGVSRTVVREAVKVLADKGMVQVRPRSGTRARSRAEWNLLDPDILAWQAQLRPDAQFLRDLCEVRLAIEPVASGFAALRATAGEIAAIGRCLEERENPGDVVALDLQFHAAVVAACHNTLLEHLSATIREPFRIALSYTSRLAASAELDLAAHRKLFDAIAHRDPLKARAASDEIIGLAMLSVEQVIRSKAFQQEARRRS